MDKLTQILKEISDNFKWQVYIGFELEFYLVNVTKSSLQPFLTNFLQKYPMCLIEEEKGTNQFEIKIKHTNDILNLITNTNEIKEYLLNEASLYNMIADFSSKPFACEPGSSLHVNISLHDANGNIYAKKGATESHYLLYSIGGLCKYMLEDLDIFLPEQKDFSRIVPKQNSPTTVSWGGNNRTVAIRVPTTDPINRRIEHRVPSANADPRKTVEAILFAIIDGINNQIQPPNKIYGDASLASYALKPLTPL